MSKAAFRIKSTIHGTSFTLKEMVPTPTSKKGEAPLKARGHSELYSGSSQANSCRNGIDSVIQNSIDPKAYHREVSKNGRHYFNMKAVNNQIIFTSPLRKSKTKMEEDILFTMENAASAVILWGKQSS